MCRSKGRESEEAADGDTDAGLGQRLLLNVSCRQQSASACQRMRTVKEHDASSDCPTSLEDMAEADLALKDLRNALFVVRARNGCPKGLTLSTLLSGCRTHANIRADNWGIVRGGPEL